MRLNLPVLCVTGLLSACVPQTPGAMRRPPRDPGRPAPPEVVLPDRRPPVEPGIGPRRNPPAARRSTARLRTQLDSLIRGVPGAEVGIWFKEFDTGTTLGVNADLVMHAASTMKVPVMIELFRRADAGALSLDQTVVLSNRFASIVDGSPYSLSADDDSDSTLYAKVGTAVTLRELNERMITHSSNLATNALIELLGAASVNATSRRLGAGGMTVLRGVEDGKAFEKGLNNTTTARALGALLESIEFARAASLASCTAMRDILLRQTETGEIPAGLPPQTPVAHKTGWITATTHDAAIIYPPRRQPYILVVLTRKIPDRAVAQRLMADISRAAWATATASR